MIVVGDTSVISNLHLVGHLDILQRLFHSVIIPQKVRDELLELRHFGVDVSPMLSAPFLNVQTPVNQTLVQEFLAQIDEGEAQAIVLALEVKADLILMDELKGRGIAEQQGLNVTGLLGVLLRAKKRGFLTQIKPVLERLTTEAGFYIGEKLFYQILQMAKE